MVEIVQDAVPPMKMKKDRFGKGLTTVYSATSAFHEPSQQRYDEGHSL
jgi:hypothetical protein